MKEQRAIPSQAIDSTPLGAASFELSCEVQSRLAVRNSMSITAPSSSTPFAMS